MPFLEAIRSSARFTGYYSGKEQKNRRNREKESEWIRRERDTLKISSFMDATCIGTETIFWSDKSLFGETNWNQWNGPNFLPLSVSDRLGNAQQQRKERIPFHFTPRTMEIPFFHWSHIEASDCSSLLCQPLLQQHTFTHIFLVLLKLNGKDHSGN